MPTSPALAEDLAEPLLRLYLEAEIVLLRAISRRLVRGIDEPGWADEKLGEVRALEREVLDQIGILDREGPQLVAEAVNSAYDRGAAAATADLQSSGLTVSGGFFRSNPFAVQALVREAVSATQATRFRIFRSVTDAYRAAVTSSVGQVTLGTQTRRQAAQVTLDRLLGGGVTGFVDRAGRGWDLASYAEMATRTAAGHAAVLGSMDRLSAEGQDLVIVSNVPGECVRCRAWEGVTLSINGTTPGYRTVADARGSGLFHPGCRHSLGIYLPGVTPPMGETADPAGDAARQQQRYLERQIRQWKNRSALALDEQTRQQANAKVRQWQARIREHVAATGGKRLYYREQITRAR